MNMPMMTYLAMHPFEITEEWMAWAVAVVVAVIVGCLAFMIGVFIKDRRR